MTEGLVIALLAILGTGVSAIIAYLLMLVRENRLLWLWARELVDFAYRHNPSNDPLPEPPAFLARKDKP